MASSKSAISHRNDSKFCGFSQLLVVATTFWQRCNLSDVLDAMLEQADWAKMAKEASNKPVQRAMERGGSYKV
jgi:hypothetical protein